MGHGRHARRHRAVLDGVRARARRRVRRHVDRRRRPLDHRLRPARRGRRAARARRRRPRAARRSSSGCSTASSPGSASACRGGPAPAGCWPSSTTRACRARSSRCRGAGSSTPSSTRSRRSRSRPSSPATTCATASRTPSRTCWPPRALGVDPARVRGDRGLPDRRRVGDGRRLRRRRRAQPRRHRRRRPAAIVVPTPEGRRTSTTSARYVADDAAAGAPPARAARRGRRATQARRRRRRRRRRPSLAVVAVAIAVVARRSAAATTPPPPRPPGALERPRVGAVLGARRRPARARRPRRHAPPAVAVLVPGHRRRHDRGRSRTRRPTQAEQFLDAARDRDVAARRLDPRRHRAGVMAGDPRRPRPARPPRRRHRRLRRRRRLRRHRHRLRAVRLRRRHATRGRRHGRTGWPSSASWPTALHADGRTLTVSIPPVYDAGQTDDSGYWVYDYAAITPLVDSIRVMAYDYSVPSGGPGPIAPLAWVERVIAGTSAASRRPVQARARHPAVRLQLPVVARRARARRPPRASPRSPTATVDDLAARRGATPVFDPATDEWSFTYELVVDDGTTSCTQQRQVHYVDADGAQHRMQRAVDAGFGGVVAVRPRLRGRGACGRAVDTDRRPARTDRPRRPATSG